MFLKPTILDTAIENSMSSSWHVDEAVKVCFFALKLITAPFIIAVVHPLLTPIGYYHGSTVVPVVVPVFWPLL